MQSITKGLSYWNNFYKKNKVHFIKFEQQANANLTLLLSKLSEAVAPNTVKNHLGEGSVLNNIFVHQKGIRFIINGGFSHYRKNFYEWPHQNYNVGDPVGIVKIREHFFNDSIDTKHYGFLTQKNKGDNWSITNEESLDINSKYILGCTPLLIYNSKEVTVPTELAALLPPGVINPPGVLAHANIPNARTAVGIKGSDILFISVEANPGITLEELTKIGTGENLEFLLNLDGGGSTQFKIITDSAGIIENNILPEDKNRVLGHSIILFDNSLK